MRWSSGYLSAALAEVWGRASDSGRLFGRLGCLERLGSGPGRVARLMLEACRLDPYASLKRVVGLAAETWRLAILDLETQT